MADPGFPRGGTNLLFGKNFTKKLHEIEGYWTASAPPPRIRQCICALKPSNSITIHALC